MVGVGGTFQPIFFAPTLFTAAAVAAQGRKGSSKEQREQRLQVKVQNKGDRRGASGLKAGGPAASRATRGSVSGRPGGGRGTRAGAAAPGAKAAPRSLPRTATALGAPRVDARTAIGQSVTGLGYELVDIERLPGGLLRVSIDRVPGRTYPGGASEFVTVDDCELVTRQLQHLLEVEGVDYARLEVSSPGLDRPLRTAADYRRFTGLQIALTLKDPLAGRKTFRGVLGRAADEAAPAAADAAPGDEDAGWTLVFAAGREDQVLSFALHEVREARLVPVLNFKGRQGRKTAEAGEPGAAAEVSPPAAGDNGGLGE